MRLDLDQLDVETFPISDPESDEIMATQYPCPGPTTSPCLDSLKTCGPECIAAAPGDNN